MKARDQRVMWLYRREPIKVGYRPAKIGDHKHFDSRDIVVLVFRVILQDHVIKGSCEFIGRSPSM